ncbi:MAG: low molecular weight protein-tyrosine-phosphatase [Parachlamydiales bacterium]
MTRVLFVCLGNICRSPAGQGILERMAKERGLDLEVASCALGDWHLGKLPDPRMRKAAKKRGLDLKSRAAVFHPDFFEHFDYILAADRSILAEIVRRAEGDYPTDHLYLIGDFSSKWPNQDIPDPYHGTEEDFELALDMLEEACEGFCKALATPS